MTKECRNPNDECEAAARFIHHPQQNCSGGSCFVILSSFVLRHSSLLWVLGSTLAFVIGTSAAPLPSDSQTSEAVECANLIYAGTKSSVCFSEEFLSAVASQTSINTARKFKPVKLAEKEVFRFPFSVMTGEGAFSLTDDERKNLKLYV